MTQQQTYRVTVESGAIVSSYDIDATSEGNAGQDAMMAFEASVSERRALNASVTMIEILPGGNDQ